MVNTHAFKITLFVVTINKNCRSSGVPKIVLRITNEHQCKYWSGRLHHVWASLRLYKKEYGALDA